MVVDLNGIAGFYYDTYAVMQKQGNVMLSQVPYDQNCLTLSPDEEIWKTSITYRLKDFQKFKSIGYGESVITSVDDTDLDAIKTSLSNGEILAYSTYVNSWNCTNIETNSSVPENATYIIFTNGSNQTVNISYSGGEVRYYPVSSTDSKGRYEVETW